MALKETLNANFKQLQEENKVNNAYLTGGLSVEKKMFNQLKEMKRSTFDRSKFTIVGNPTITENGIASGFSSGIFYSNYSFNPTGSWKIKGIFITGDDISTSQVILSSRTGETNIRRRFAVTIEKPTQFGWGISTNGTSWAGNYKVINYNIKQNTKYYYELCFDGISEYGLNIGEIGNIANSKYTQTAKLVTSDADGSIRFGEDWSNTFKPFLGSIDIKQFSIEIDDKEVFNGNKTGVDQITDTLEIPYTLSKTGSKIVDSVYRDRVQDVYEKFGYAPYYTLSDNDFTLPMGEIYGMIENFRQYTETLSNNLDIKKQDKCIHIIDTYTNGNSGYNIWSNGYCEQWGRVSAGATSRTVAFTKHFKDTRYCITIGIVHTNTAGGVGTSPNIATNSIATTGFTISQYSSAEFAMWRACGYLAEDQY